MVALAVAVVTVVVIRAIRTKAARTSPTTPAQHSTRMHLSRVKNLLLMRRLEGVAHDDTLVSLLLLVILSLIT